jgi:threonine dehydrogenase-like Zn-dependent dehydrogenase
MRAITVIPMKAGSVRVDELGDVRPGPSELLVEGLAMGVCGTDLEIVRGQYGWAPPGRERLILGHESLGRVLEAPPGSGFQRGDLVVGIVRRPDPVPCRHCAVLQWDMCSNGQYTERGIKSLDGYGAQRYALESSFAIKLDPSLSKVGVLLEPASVLAKAWDHTDRIGGRVAWEPKRALVVGAGPIGLLAALLGRQRGLEVHVLDRETAGPKPGLVAALGAHYHIGKIADAGPTPDVILECTGVPQLVLDSIQHLGPDGVLCLTGVSTAGPTIGIDAGAINRQLVLENGVIFGSVNANRRHYEAASEALGRADKSWLEGLITRRVGLGDLGHAFERQRDDVKVVIDLTA